MTLEEFIDNNPDPRELKRALAVKMRRSGYTHHKIQEILNVVSSFISKWEPRYIEQGIEGLKLGYSPKRELSFISREKRSNSFDYRYAYPFDRGKITMMKTPDASSTISEPKRKIEPTRKLSYWKLKSPKFGTTKKAKTELNNFLEQSRQCNHAEGSLNAIALLLGLKMSND